MSVAVVLSRLGPGDLGRVDGLQLYGDQPAFVGDWRGVLRGEVREGGEVGAWAIVWDEEAVGILFLRRGGALRPWAPADAVTLHSFLIDADHQGRGLAGAAVAVLPETARAFAPAARRLMLAVNAGNEAARAVWLHLGFADEGDRFEGPKGPQIVLSRPL